MSRVPAGRHRRRRRFKPNSLTIVKKRYVVGVLEGEYINPVTKLVDRRFSTYPVDFQPEPQSPLGVFPEPTQAQKEAYATKIMAATNPSAAHISVPTVLGELRELPDLVKDWGGDLLHKMAKGHLSWRWGIKPMIGEVRKLLDFQKAVEERVMMFKRLKHYGQVARRCSLGRDTVKQNLPRVAIQSNVGVVYCNRTVTYTQKVWGSAQYFCNSNTVLPSSRAEAINQAYVLTFGLTSYELLAAAWELLPWSWFVDWFAEVGSVIAANNNTINLTRKNVCLMRTVSSKTEYTRDTSVGDSWPKLVLSPSEEETRKLRYVNLPFEVPQMTLSTMALVEPKTWSILGSLAVLRRNKWAKRYLGY